ncbi:DUF881 domain-containing protein [Mycolicibacterium litorale]|uniref:Membrane protein n=1 Tax=Mycolicibacterium litorale TaxID=758802 RepID=A0AAD1IS83_9MYCO|nr:DUF881 domain-containing protein [Mycolicibacterium litorale]MCV7417353.1 DUF881 domain-containing protein [Mycolicibacterium litorale]TDY05142.1 uncharacterized protein YlxW (UPF0749 family) [Mycolicibacterium litorale]BBY18577.1 membrane protein [Mycolicibacterium litorale]
MVQMPPEPNVGPAGETPPTETAAPAAPARAPAGRRSAWRFGVPLVCLAAGLLLAATHGVSGGDEIRRSDAPRLVDLVRETQQSVDRLGAERDQMSAAVDGHHGDSPGTDAALTAITDRSAALAVDAGLDPVKGPGLVVTLNDAQRDAEGRFPRDASPDDLVVHQQDIQGVLNALWSAGAEGVQMQDQRIIATSAPRCVGNTLLLNGRTYSPPYVITAVGDTAAMQAALSASPLVSLYKQYVVRFGLGYTEEPRAEVELVGHSEPVRMQYAKPIGPLGY